MNIVVRSLVKQVVILLVCCAILNLSAAMAEKQYRVMVLPMQIHSEKDLGFLKKGIEDMLHTRLALEGKVIVIDHQTVNQALQNISGPITEQTAYTLGQQLGADYVVWGSLTILGESISTDARCLEVQAGKPVVTFSQFGKTQGDVIYHIDRFAGQVNDTVFGRKTYTYVREAAPAPGSDRRKHPESLWVDLDKQTMSGTPGSDFWKSTRFKTAITSISIGDVDGDGKNEIVFIDGRSLVVQRYVDGRLEKIKEIKQATGNELIGVDVADINDNGYAEIFVTSLNRANVSMNSFVLEWNGEAFAEIVRDQNWYYRVGETPNRGIMLLGQKRSTEGLFYGGVNRLTWQGSGYSPDEKLDLPKGQRIFGFAIGDVMNEGREIVVHYTRDNYLRIEDPGRNREIWTSDEKFGGSPNYLDNTRPSDRGSSTFAKNRYFLPQRVHVVDIDKDGKFEVITPKNKEFIGGALAKLRNYTSGNVQWLTWSGSGLAPKMKTPDTSGYISDLAIADLDNDGETEIVYSIVAKKTNIMGSQKSYIAAIKPKISQSQ